MIRSEITVASSARDKWECKP